MNFGKLNLLLLLLCGTVAGFSSGILVNINRLRVQNHNQLFKMKANSFKRAKKSKVYTKSFAIQFLEAFAKLARKQRMERMNLS